MPLISEDDSPHFDAPPTFGVTEPRTPLFDLGPPIGGAIVSLPLWVIVSIATADQFDPTMENAHELAALAFIAMTLFIVVCAGIASIRAIIGAADNAD